MTRKKKRANASVGQNIWCEPRISSLFVQRNKRRCPCGLCISGCSCAGLPIFSRRLTVCLDSRRHWFFLRFCLSDREHCYFVGEGIQTHPHWVRSGALIILQRENLQLFQNQWCSFIIRSVFKKCRCQRLGSCKSEKSTLGADLERATICLNTQRTRSSSHHTGFTCEGSA